MSSDSIRILGIDPGLRITGWGMIEVQGTRIRHVEHGTIRPDVKASLAERLSVLFSEMGALVADYSPDECAIEEAFMANNASSALKLGHARAAGLLAPAHAGVPVYEYAARLVKKSVVGTGAADKAQIGAMIGVLLPGCKASADAADALAIAICHSHHRKAHSLGSAA
ncbi:MAG: crossover junction endodeoxyribonuclease RuvC [Alphaproteobacteria bacterium]|nr:crossover junction endodeoxyribonuclease RuvC [Alphaproteobacteria bacterium]